MQLLFRHLTKQFVDATSSLQDRLQRLEADQADLRAKFETAHEVRVNTAETQPIRPAERIPEARRVVETRPTLRRGQAGGLARARMAWRYLDGTFMPESEKFEAYQQEYERYAAGGRARAANARRHGDGRFARY
jgi:hypothetical protein